MWRGIAAFGVTRLLAEGRRCSFVTLTSHKYVKGTLAGVSVWRKAWPKLSARWRRAEHSLQYCYTAEVSKMARFHVHIVTTATLPSRWYKDNAAETGLGYIAKAIPLQSGSQAGNYITKYLTKAVSDGGWPKFWRRVNTSRAFPKPEVVPSPYEWIALGRDEYAVHVEVIRYKRDGWQVVESY